MDEEISGIKISEFPDAPSISNSDVVTGLHDNDNANFTFARIMAWLRAAVADFFVPNSRKVNNKALSADISLTASDVGARGADWIPTAAQVGARPDTWVPTAAQVGAVPVEAVGVAGGIPNLDEIGRVPASQLPQYPTVPSASAATPQMDGTPSPGSTGEWADGGHTHPTDTTRAAAALEINGHPLTGDFDLTASDVGALADDGTAVLSNAIAARHTISGEAGWYKFLSIPYVNGGSRDLCIMINTGGNDSSRSGILEIHMRSTLQGVDVRYVNLVVARMPKDWVRYENLTESGQRYLTLYIRKESPAGGQMQFFVLYAVNHAGTVLGNLAWSSDGPASNPPATATSATSNTFTDATRILYFQAQPVSAGSAQQLISITDADISADHVLAGITFADPEYITGSGSWASTAGSFTLTGTATAATTGDILLIRKGN